MLSTLKSSPNGEETRSQTTKGDRIQKKNALKNLHKAFFGEISSAGNGKVTSSGNFIERQAMQTYITTIEVRDSKIVDITTIRSAVKMED